MKGKNWISQYRQFEEFCCGGQHRYGAVVDGHKWRRESRGSSSICDVFVLRGITPACL